MNPVGVISILYAARWSGRVVPSFPTYERRSHDVACERKEHTYSSETVYRIQLSPLIKHKPNVWDSRDMRGHTARD